MGRPRTARDAGETLIEIVISIMMIGIMVSAVVLAVGEGAQLTGVHQQIVTTEIGLKVAAEAVKDAPFVSGKDGAALASDYQGIAQASAPAGHSVAVKPVACAPKTTTATYSAASAATCTAATSTEGLQLVTLTVSTNGGTTATAESTVVVKRKS